MLFYFAGTFLIYKIRVILEFIRKKVIGWAIFFRIKSGAASSPKVDERVNNVQASLFSFAGLFQAE